MAAELRHGALVSCRGDKSRKSTSAARWTWLVMRIPVKGGPHTIEPLFVGEYGRGRNPYRAGSNNSPWRKTAEPWLERVDISGPWA
jgi:hypothetical protein